MCVASVQLALALGRRISLRRKSHAEGAFRLRPLSDSFIRFTPRIVGSHKAQGGVQAVTQNWNGLRQMKTLTPGTKDMPSAVAREYAHKGHRFASATGDRILEVERRREKALNRWLVVSRIPAKGSRFREFTGMYVQSTEYV